MSQYKDFTSLSPEQEQTFVVFEKRTVETGQTAIKLGLAVAGVMGILVMIIVLGISPGESTAQKMEDDELSKGGGMLSGESEVVNEAKNKPTAPATATDGDKTDGDKTDGDKADGDKADGDKADGDKPEVAGDAKGEAAAADDKPKGGDSADDKAAAPKTE